MHYSNTDIIDICTHGSFNFTIFFFFVVVVVDVVEHCLCHIFRFQQCTGILLQPDSLTHGWWWLGGVFAGITLLYFRKVKYR